MDKTYTVSITDNDGATVLNVSGSAGLVALNLRAAADELQPKIKPGRKPSGSATPTE